MVFPRDRPITESKADGERTLSAALLCVQEVATIATGDPMPMMAPLEEPAPSSEQLAHRCQAGCLKSFEQLVQRYESQIFNFLRRFTPNQQDAEDLTQETFVKAYRNIHRYTPFRAFAPWLFVIARRTAASHFRSARRFEALPVDSEGGEESPATVLEQKDEQKSLWTVVRTLKPKQAEAVWLRYAEGFTVAEIARIMHTNQVYVRVLLHRAHACLSRMLIARGMDIGKLKGRPDGGTRPPKDAE